MPTEVYNATIEAAQQPPPGHARDRFGERLEAAPYATLGIVQRAMNAAVADVSSKVAAGEIPTGEGIRAIGLLRHVQLSAGCERARRDLSHPGLEADRYGEPASLTWLCKRLALGRIRSELSDRQLTRLIDRARLGDVDTLAALHDDGVTVADLRSLIAGAR